MDVATAADVTVAAAEVSLAEITAANGSSGSCCFPASAATAPASASAIAADAAIIADVAIIADAAITAATIVAVAAKF